jgi:hypothetical protein
MPRVKRCFVSALAASLVACSHGSSTPTDPQRGTTATSAVAAEAGRISPDTRSASGLSGSYELAATIAGSCGVVSRKEEVHLTQAASDVAFMLGVDSGGVSGAIRGGTVHWRWTEAQDAGIICHGTLTGSGSLAGRVITGTVHGTTSCGCGPRERISFTLTPRSQP